jgi:hypothetical protein
MVSFVPFPCDPMAALRHPQEASWQVLSPLPPSLLLLYQPGVQLVLLMRLVSYLSAPIPWHLTLFSSRGEAWETNWLLTWHPVPQALE